MTDALPEQAEAVSTPERKPPPSLLDNSLKALAAQVIMAGAKFGVFLLVARRLGVEGQGVFALALAVTSVVGTVSTMGIDTASAFYSGRLRDRLHVVAGNAAVVNLVGWLILGFIEDVHSRPVITEGLQHGFVAFHQFAVVPSSRFLEGFQHDLLQISGNVVPRLFVDDEHVWKVLVIGKRQVFRQLPPFYRGVA